MDERIAVDPTSVWVNGKVEPGWYMARAIWNKQYAEDIRALGYEVERRRMHPKTRQWITVPESEVLA